MLNFPDPTILQWPDFVDTLPAGYSLTEADGVLKAIGPSNKTQAQIDAKIQTSIDSYSILPFAKKQGITQIKRRRTQQYYLLYTPEVTASDPTVQAQFVDDFGNTIDVFFDLWASINAGAKTANAGWQKVLDTRAAGATAITSVKAVTSQANAAATMAAVQTIVDAIVWPV
jgi:hypothetical protein